MCYAYGANRRATVAASLGRRPLYAHGRDDGGFVTRESASTPLPHDRAHHGSEQIVEARQSISLMLCEQRKNTRKMRKASGNRSSPLLLCCRSPGPTFARTRSAVTVGAVSTVTRHRNVCASRTRNSVARGGARRRITERGRSSRSPPPLVAAPQEQLFPISFPITPASPLLDISHSLSLHTIHISLSLTDQWERATIDDLRSDSNRRYEITPPPPPPPPRQ